MGDDVLTPGLKGPFNSILKKTRILFLKQVNISASQQMVMSAFEQIAGFFHQEQLVGEIA